MSVSHPVSIIIDKISITKFESNPDQFTTADLLDRLHSLLAGIGIHQSAIRSGQRHRHQVNLPIPTNSNSMVGSALFQFGPRFAQLPDYRIEFNPATLGHIGIANLIGLLDQLLPEGGISFIGNGRVTRLDIAADIIGIEAGDVIVRSKGHRVHGIFSDQYGAPDTVYFGSQKSNRTSVYNKKKELVPVLRVERRGLPRKPGHDIHSLKDPFQKIQMIETGPLSTIIANEVPEMIPEHLFDSMRVRGCSHAIEKLPPALRRAITAALKNPDLSALPHDLWAQWPATLESYGLGFLLPTSPTDLQQVA